MMLCIVNPVVDIMGRLSERIKYYSENTTIHGIGHITNNNLHVLERLSWFIAVAISTYGMFVIFIASYDAYDNNPISFATETTYLDWNTTFPAVTVCQLVNPDLFSGTESKDNIYQNFISEVVFFTGACYTCAKKCPECEKADIDSLLKKYRKTCEELLGTCTWNGKPFKCCDRFKPLKTEYGTCYSINSMYHGELSLLSNRFDGPGELFIITLDDIRVFFHGPEEVPFINADPDKRDDVLLGDRYLKRFRIVEIDNDEEVKSLPVEKRGCRFPWETPPGMNVHELYSYSACIVQCHVDAHLKLCNCTHHLMPNMPKKLHCDIKGLKCLTDNYETLNRLHAKGFVKKGLECDCDPSCTEAEYSVVFKENGVTGSEGHIIMTMQSLPTQRYKRNVVRSVLDLVVSIGGTAGLFFGASLLSLMEVIYLLILRRNRIPNKIQK